MEEAHVWTHSRDLESLAHAFAVHANRIPNFSERPTVLLPADVLKGMPGYKKDDGS